MRHKIDIPVTILQKCEIILSKKKKTSLKIGAYIIVLASQKSYNTYGKWLRGTRN